MIPEISRPEWYDLVTGRQTYIITNFVLQMKVTQAIQDISTGVKSPQQAVFEIHSLCAKYQKAVAKDLTTIFG